MCVERRLLNFSVVEGWHVPSIRPLETLHNMLTLKQMTNFINQVTAGRASPTPNSSPTREACTPRRFSKVLSHHHPRSSSSMPSQVFSKNPVLKDRLVAFFATGGITIHDSSHRTPGFKIMPAAKDKTSPSDESRT